MSEKLPPPTDVLIRRLRRYAKWLDAAACTPAEEARVNLCYQAAARLEELDAPRAGYEDFVKRTKGGMA